MFRYFPTSALLSGLALIMSFSAARAEVTELNLVDPDHGFGNVYRSYSSMDEKYERRGSTTLPAQVGAIMPGAGEDEVRARLGKPLEEEGDGSWIYHLSLPLPQGNELICQYRLHFDNDRKVIGSVWRRPQCADLIGAARG